MASELTNESTMQPQARNVRVAPHDSYGAYVNRWAIIVGISQYKHQRLNLKYADRDADELYKLLQTPSGGGFEAERIIKLINDEATTSKITWALRSFLKKPARDDIVLLYFACHGSPDVDRPGIVYFLTYESDPDDISGTALPMREIDLSLKENLLAERVVIIADTCHSAAIGGKIGRRSTGNDAHVINTYLEEVSKAKGGVALLTSAEASESSQEGPQWGGGHGVFTHFLLQGMKGDADGFGQPKDGVVTVGELFDYVRKNVQNATNNIQHPAIGTNPFDRNLPIAITGGINAQEHYQLGCRICDLGWILDDIRRFQVAAEQFNEAIRLSRMAMTPFPKAELGLGKALLALGDHKGAIRILSGLIDRNKDEIPAESLLLLGIAQAKSLDYLSAVSTFERFLGQYPEDNDSMWVREYIGWLKSNTGSRKYALLIGINEYMSPNIPRLAGCVNDTLMIEKVLLQRYGFEKNNISILLDNKATRQGILNAFESLRKKATTADTVLVYYSGHSIPESQRDAFKGKPENDLYLVVHDTINESGLMRKGISSIDLHRMMNVIPSMNKTLILDTHPSIQFNELVEKDGSYTLLLATDSAEIAYESHFEVEGELIQAGLFTFVLNRQLGESNPESLTFGQLLDASLARIRTLGYNQTPLLIGDRDQLIFNREEIYLNLFGFARRRNYDAFTLENLRKQYSRYCRNIDALYAEAHYSFGCAFLKKGDHTAAMNALQTALQQRNGNYPEALIALGRAQIGAGLYMEALESFRKYVDVAPEEIITFAQELIGKTDKLIHSKKHALLVGINEYINPDILPVRGAVNDVLAFKDILMTKLGFQEEDIKMLLNHEATRAAIMDNFKQLIEKGRDEPALFYFAGNGSITEDSSPTIVSVDGRQGVIYDIPLQELAETASIDLSNLVTILDAGWTRYSKTFDGSRTIPVDSRERNITRDISVAREMERYNIKIGIISIYNYSIKNSFSSRTHKLETRLKGTRLGLKGMYHGTLTHTLIKDLNKIEMGNLTYSKWLGSVSEVLGSFAPVVIGDYQDGLIFGSRKLEKNVTSLITRLEQEPIYEIIRILRRMIEQREQQNDFFPEGKLNLGIAYAAIGEYDKSISALESAITLYSDMKIMAYEKEKDPNAQKHYHDAYYQLGRILFERGGNFAKSVSELNEAIRLDPENTHAYYYLGQAIREMVDRETLTKAEDALKTYLAKGAPLGHEDEVRQFLGSRKTKEIIQDFRI